MFAPAITKNGLTCRIFIFNISWNSVEILKVHTYYFLFCSALTAQLDYIFRLFSWYFLGNILDFERNLFHVNFPLAARDGVKFGAYVWIDVCYAVTWPCEYENCCILCHRLYTCELLYVMILHNYANCYLQCCHMTIWMCKLLHAINTTIMRVDACYAIAWSLEWLC